MRKITLSRARIIAKENGQPRYFSKSNMYFFGDTETNMTIYQTDYGYLIKREPRPFLMDSNFQPPDTKLDFNFRHID